MKKADEFNLIIAGVGGQGNMLAAAILADAAIEEGYKVRLTETYGGATRGGAVFSLLRIGQEDFAPFILKYELDGLVGLEPMEALRRGVDYLSEDGFTLVNTTPFYPVDVNLGRAKYVEVETIMSDLAELCAKVYAFDATSLAKQAGDIRSVNVCMLGALVETGELPVDAVKVREAMLASVPEATVQTNLKAFEAGRSALASAKTCTRSGKRGKTG
jgi:indolepyruvate ferredoxin oxidoreductase beta subunit